MAGLALLLVVTGAVSFGMTTDMKASTSLAAKAERQALVSSLVDDQRQGVAWGTPSAPTTQTMTLKNGATTKVTLWQEPTSVGTTLTAVTPTDAGPDAADCTAPASVEKAGCTYAHRFHAAGVDDVSPDTIIRKDPTTAPGRVIGTVDARVGTTASIPQGTVFASGTDAVATTWRYLVTASSVEAAGEVRFSQAGKILATVPVSQAVNNYFGTFSAQTNVPVTATVTQGNVVVQTVMTYRAGGS
jgi:hypothetical protein